MSIPKEEVEGENETEIGIEQLEVKQTDVERQARKASGSGSASVDWCGGYGVAVMV